MASGFDSFHGKAWQVAPGPPPRTLKERLPDRGDLRHPPRGRHPPATRPRRHMVHHKECEFPLPRIWNLSKQKDSPLFERAFKGSREEPERAQNLPLFVISEAFTRFDYHSRRVRGQKGPFPPSAPWCTKIRGVGIFVAV